MLAIIVCDREGPAHAKGRGHISRMTAMEQEGRRRGHSIAWVDSWSEAIGCGRPHVVIVDDYMVGKTALAELATMSRLVVFDDYQPKRIPDGALFVVSPGSLPEVYAPHEALCGFDYAPIRDEVRYACGAGRTYRIADAVFADGVLTHGGQASLEAAYLGVKQEIRAEVENVCGNVQRLSEGERPDGRGAERVWRMIEARLYLPAGLDIPAYRERAAWLR